MSAKISRKILHIDLDSFFVSVERVLDPSLEGKPVLVSGNPEGRGVVSSASYEARKFGVRSAMPMARARKLCPQCIILPVRMNAYADYSEKVFEMLRAFSPLVEEASIDEAYLDVTGTEKLFGPPRKLAEKIQKTIRQKLGLPSSIGIGSNKLVAKIASKLAKPLGIVEVPTGKEKEFMAELSIRAIPGVGGKTESKLKQLGAAKVKEIAGLGQDLLKHEFGSWGEELWDRAQGIGDDIVEPEEAAPKRLSKEITFDEDISDPGQIELWLCMLANLLGIRLRKRGLFAKRLTVKFRSPDFKTWTRTVGLTTPTSQDFDLFAAALRILEKEKTRNLLIRLIGIAASDLTPTRQLSMFEKEQIEKRDRLFKAIDKSREKFGLDSIYPASIIELIHQGKKGDNDEN
jgi:DNA polymerase-4